MENDRRSMSPGREKRVRVVNHRDYGKLSTKSPRLTSKGDRTLRDLLRDFATDKRAFINTSTILVDLYMIPIKARKILNDRETEEMFCNIRQIIAAEQQALKVVEEELHGDEADVISIIKGMLENLNIFGTYCRNLPKAMSLLVWHRKIPTFVEFEKNRLQASTLGLDNLLTYPFEQIKRYDRILADWVPFFRSTDLYPEFEVSRSRILDYIDDLRKQVDGLIDKQKVVDIIATIDPSSINCELSTPTTTFVKEGVVHVLVKQLFISKKEKSSTKVKFSKKPEEVLIYLFSDSIIVLRRKKNKNNKKKRPVELYDNKLLARIPLATSRFIIVSDATAQKVLQFVHDGLSYAFLFDNERVWRDWQKKIKAQVKESMKKKIQKDKDHPILPKSARMSKRGVEWAKKYHTMDTPQQPIVKTEVAEVPKTPRNSEFQNQTLFQFKHRTTSFNSVVKNDVKVVSHATPQSKKRHRDSTFEVVLRPRAFTIASTEYSIVPESFPVVEEPEFGSTSFNSLKWAKVLNVDTDSPVNTPPVSPSESKSLMSPRISELVKKFSSDLTSQSASPRNNENNTNVTDLKSALSLPALANASTNPIDALSPRSLSNLYRPESISPRSRGAQVTAPVEKRPASPPRPSVELDPKPEHKNLPESKPEEPSRGVNTTTESPLGARKLLGRSGSIMIGGRSNLINTGSNTSSSNSTPKISPRSTTDPSLNTETVNEAGSNSASVSSPSLSRGWTRVGSIGNLNTSGLLNKKVKNSDEHSQAVIGTRGSSSPRADTEGNNNNLVSPREDKLHNIDASLKSDIDNFDYDPDWQFGFTQDGRLYYYNTKLNQRTWERPKNIMPNPILDDVNAPHNWREMFSPQGYVYYLNVVTKQTSWFRTYLPAQHAQLLSYYNSLLLSALRNKRAENGATSPLASPKASDQLLDSQWKEVVSPDGRRFYFNELTQTASWNPPTSSNLLNLTALSQTNSIFSPAKDEDEKKLKRKKSKA